MARKDGKKNVVRGGRRQREDADGWSGEEDEESR
jgi:hypothetical protein